MSTRNFKSSGPISMNEIKIFIDGDNLGTSHSDIKLGTMFSEAQSLTPQPAVLPNGNSAAPHAMSEFYDASILTSSIQITSIEEVLGINSTNIKEACETLIANPGVMSAGPLFGPDNARYNVPGAYEIVLAPGYRIKGDIGEQWTRSRRYVIDVDTSGFVYNRHFRYQFRNERSDAAYGVQNSTLYGLSTASSIDPYEQYVNNWSDLLSAWNSVAASEVRSKSAWGEDHWRIFGRGENRGANFPWENFIEIEENTTGFTAGTVLEFNHPVRWGNVGANVAQRNFNYTLPRDMESVTIIGGGGGGGASNSQGDGGSGSGGDSGGFRFALSLTKNSGEVARIRVGPGGVGASFWFNGPLAIHPNAQATDNIGNTLWNNFYSFGFGGRGLNSAIQFGSASEIVSTGGGGGISAFNGSTVGTPVIMENIGPGTPDGQAGGVPPHDSDQTQQGGDTGAVNNIGDGGLGIWAQNFYGFGHQSGTYGNASLGNTSGSDGAVWIILS